MDFAALARRMLGLPEGEPQGPPDAMSRITRTPIYVRPELDDGSGGQYLIGRNKILIRRDELDRGSSVLPHESAHALFDLGGLGSHAPELVNKVPEAQRNKISYLHDLYPDPTDYTKTNEGLGYSIGDPDATGYVKAAADKMQSPELRRMLLRLHNNRVATNRIGGLGNLR